LELGGALFGDQWIKKLTALIEYWPVEARDQLLEAAWSIDGKLIAAAIDRGIGGGP
jgi:hypothetical protein